MPTGTPQARRSAACFRTLVLFGVAAAFGAAFTLPSALGLDNAALGFGRVQQVGHQATGPPSSAPPPPPNAPRPPHFTFAHGTFQPPPSSSVLGCSDLDDRLSDQHLTEAIDVCFDAQFSCSRAEPFVGMAMIGGLSGGNPQAGKQASIRVEGSDSWLPALVPVHAPRGSRVTTKHPVPVVGCLIDNGSRFVLSWADIRCRASTNSPFPAKCDGANRRNVAIEDATAAVSFVDNLTQESRRKLDLGDTDNNFVRGKKRVVLVLISPSGPSSALAAWNGKYGNGYGSPNDWVDAVVRGHPQAHSPPARLAAPS